MAGRQLELEKLAAANGNASKLNAPAPLPGTPEDIAEIRANAQFLPKYMIAMFDIQKVVYCRYGRDYIPQVARQIQLSNNNPAYNQPVR